MLPIEDDEIDTDTGVIVDDGDYKPQIIKTTKNGCLATTLTALLSLLVIMIAFIFSFCS